MRDLEKIRNIILARLGADFQNMKIMDVRIREQNDSDGARVLLIDVVFKGERKEVDAKALTGIVRKIRPDLLKNDEEGFPVFSFIAQREMGALAREPARPH